MCAREYYDSSGFHTIELDIKDEANGAILELQGETIALDTFSAKDGNVTGEFRYTFSKEYARWGTSNYIDVSFELAAVSGQLERYYQVTSVVDSYSSEKSFHR